MSAGARVLSDREFSRKSFLRGGGSLVIGLSVGGLAAQAAGAANNPTAIAASHTGALPGPPDATQVDSWLQVNSDNTVTLFAGWTELGQGTPTAVRMIAAEELGLSMDQVTQVQVDTNVSLSAFTVGSTSTSTAMGATSMRGAAAAARTLLLNMASAQLGVPAASLSVSNGVVSGGGKTVKYSDLAAGKLFNSTIAAAKATLTPGEQLQADRDEGSADRHPGIVTGRTTYIQNVRVPGMLHGRVVRPRGQAALGQGATVLSIDPSSVSHIPGAQVVQKGNFVGVVAPHEWDAIQAAAQLKVKWDDDAEAAGQRQPERRPA